MKDLEGKARRTAEALASEIARESADAVILTGSWARGDAHPESDLDLRVVGDEKPKHLRRRDGFLVSIASQPLAQHRAAMNAPDEAGSIVPGWRSAAILHDSGGVAASLKEEAEAWTWDRIPSGVADAYVAKEITKLAEEAHSLFSNLDQEIWTGAAMQRSTIALETAPVMAVHHRLLYETEKKLWDLVAEKQGPEWEKAQERSLGEGGETFRDTCVAAFELFRLAAQTTAGLLDADQKEVVDHALTLSPAPLL
jgi:hypothetical protein